MARRRRTSQVVFATANVVALVGFALFGGYYFYKYQNLKDNPPSQQETDNRLKERYTKEVGKLYTLPTDEEPTLATVSDKEKLKDQPFFEKAENGDITLIYTNARLAILYRPSNRQIINVSTVSISDSKPSVIIIGAQADRSVVETKLKGQLADDVVVAASSDARGSYSGIVVVDVNGDHSELAKKIADALGGKVGTLPDGEEKPSNAQIIVIAGTITP